MDQQWLWGPPPPEVVQVMGRSVLMLQKRRLAFVPREVSTLGMSMCALHYKWDRSGRPPPQQILDAVTAWCLKEGLDEFNALDLGCLVSRPYPLFFFLIFNFNRSRWHSFYTGSCRIVACDPSSPAPPTPAAYLLSPCLTLDA